MISIISNPCSYKSIKSGKETPSKNCKLLKRELLKKSCSFYWLINQWRKRISSCKEKYLSIKLRHKKTALSTRLKFFWPTSTWRLQTKYLSSQKILFKFMINLLRLPRYNQRRSNSQQIIQNQNKVLFWIQVKNILKMIYWKSMITWLIKLNKKGFSTTQAIQKFLKSKKFIKLRNLNLFQSFKINRLKINLSSNNQEKIQTEFQLKKWKRIRKYNNKMSSKAPANKIVLLQTR